VGSHPLSLEEDLDRTCGDARIQHLSPQLIGNAIVVVVYLHVIVDVDLVLLPCCQFVPLLRKRLHGGFVDRLEEVFPRYFKYLQRPAVQLLQFLPEHPVEIA
jgi:hypothetical protein